MSKINILFVHEAASQASILSNFLYKKHGNNINVKHMLFFYHKYYKKNNPNIVINLGLKINDIKSIKGKIIAGIKVIYFLISNFNNILRADVIHFFAGSSFLPNNYDLFFLKKILRKKIIMEFNGSDVRKPNYSNNINPYFKYGIGGYYNNDINVDKKIKKIDKYVNVIIVPYHELYLNVISSISNKNKVEVLYHIIDTDFYKKNKKNSNNIIKIIHAPSNRLIKGTKYIDSTIKNLQDKKYNIEYEEITNMPRDIILNKINEADIVIDQLILGDFGVFSLEAMYNNKIVLCYLLEEVINKYPKELPIINVNIDNIEIKLEKIILEFNNNKIKGNVGNKYVLKNHSEEIIGNKYLEIIKKIELL